MNSPNPNIEELDRRLVSMNDAPVLKPFGLYREEGPGKTQLGL